VRHREGATHRRRAADDVRALPVGLDVSDDDSVSHAAAALDRLDVLINNAAAYVNWSELPTEADLAPAHAALETNLFGAWRTSVAFLPLLRASEHPRIVNVSSGAGSHGERRFGLGTNRGAAPAYGISKAALNALTSKLAAELEGSGVLVNAVCPGLTATYPGAEAMGARPVEEGAAGVVWAATLPEDGHGRLLSRRRAAALVTIDEQRPARGARDRRPAARAGRERPRSAPPAAGGCDPSRSASADRRSSPPAAARRPPRRSRGTRSAARSLG
jgi:NAD(P)-dependent dehydrogenase (short-subunit alcohol dehydrogenase family)